MEIVPGFKSPDGESALAPTSCTVSEVIVVAGTTPGCSASRSVKLRPFSGTPVISVPVITSPICVLDVSTCTWLSVTVTVSFFSPTRSTTSTISAAFASIATPVRRYAPNPAALNSRS